MTSHSAGADVRAAVRGRELGPAAGHWSAASRKGAGHRRFVRPPVSRTGRTGPAARPPLPQVVPAPQAIGSRRRGAAAAAAAAAVGIGRRADFGAGLREREPQRQTSAHGTGTRQSTAAHGRWLVPKL